MAKTSSAKKKLSTTEVEELLLALKTRFEKNLTRHNGIEWASVQSRLEANHEKLWSLSIMETTGGEPDVIGIDKKTGEFIFCDCSPESPGGRRSLCYDGEALESRKEHKPKTARWRWQLLWTLSSCLKSNIENYRSWEHSILKHQAG